MKAKIKNPKTENDIYLQATAFFLAAIGTVLWDKHGFTKEQLHKALDEINYTVDSLRKGYISLDDLRQTLLEEADVKFTE